MANLHAVGLQSGVLPLSIPSTAEIVLVTLTAFNENQPAGGAQGLGAVGTIGSQGVLLRGYANLAPSAGMTVTLRLRYGSLTGAVIAGSPAGGTVSTVATTVASNVGTEILDPTLVQVGVVYVLTAQLSTGTASVNYALLTAQDATSIE